MHFSVIKLAGQSQRRRFAITMPAVNVLHAPGDMLGAFSGAQSGTDVLRICGEACRDETGEMDTPRASLSRRWGRPLA